MIRFGPAAAPRWFNQDLDRFDQYLDLLAAAGANQLEFVLLPGEQSEELGRVHLLEPLWTGAFDQACARGFHIDIHAPLPAEYRMVEWLRDPIGYDRHFTRIARQLADLETQQDSPPVYVLHAADNLPDVTGAFIDHHLNQIDRAGSKAILAVELRAPNSPADNRFDRHLDSLIRVLEPIGSDRVGVCWDVAHDWERDQTISEITTDVLKWIRHVHIHDNRFDGYVHAPLDTGVVPWRDALLQLKSVGYAGSVTLEIRYRYASEHGEPWSVLNESLRSVQSALAGE